MSTETTNKKIKIDNGTTFGRTYTDKAVDELLRGVGGSGGISVIELTDKNGTIASTQLGEINANPQNFAFKYNGKILLFTKADSTTYQYCNNTTSSSENNVMTTSTLLTITSSTGVYTIAENVHNVVANSIHPANGGDLTNIQVGSKVYSIPSGGGGEGFNKYMIERMQTDVSGTPGNHKYVISERIGFYSGYLTPPDDFNDGLCVLLGMNCNVNGGALYGIGALGINSGDPIYYIPEAKITKINEKYFLEFGAYAINSGTATMGNSIHSFVSVIYAWIYK